MNPEEKTRILIDAAPLTDRHLSGVGHVTLHIINELSTNKKFTKKYQVVLVAPLHAQELLKRWDFASSVQIRALPLPGRVLAGLMKFNLMPWMDLLLGRGVYLFPNFRNWPLLFSPSLTYIHDVAFLKYPETVRPNNQAYLTKNVPRWVKRTTMVITVSEDARQDLNQALQVPLGKIVVAPNGVNTNFYKKSGTHKIEQTKKSLGIKGEFILFVGNIEPRKNLLRLIEAFRQLPESLTRVHSLVIVGGDGWLNDEVLEAISHAQYDGYKIVRPNRFVEDSEVVDLYSGARCVVLPSIHEGFGMPVIEALACGTPVVGADIPSIREAGGELISYCNPLDVSNIGQTLKTTLETPVAPSFQKKAITWARSFTWERAVSQLLQDY